MIKHVSRRYSEAFKREVVQEYESTGLSVSDLRKKYGITGCETVQKWIKKYAKPNNQLRQIVVKSVKEIDRIKVLENQIKDLKTALADQTVEATLSRLTIKVLAEELGTTEEELKKKYTAK